MLSVIHLWVLLAAFAVYQALQLVSSLRSPLRRIPGPWYAPLTSIHLRYLFATGNVWKYVEKQQRKYGPVVRLGPRQVWFADKESIKQIISTLDLPKVAMYSEISRDRFAPGLFGEIRIEPHKRLKRFLSPAFTVNYVDNLEQVFKDVMKDLLYKYSRISEQLPEKQVSFEVDIMDDLHKAALDIMGESTFGKGFGQVNPYKTFGSGDEELDKTWSLIPHDIFDNLSSRYKFVYVKRLLRKLGYDHKYDWSKEMIAAINHIHNERAQSPDAKRQDLLQHLIDNGTKPDTGEPMNTREIIDQAAELLLAGAETTSATMACLYVELLKNPRVKAKLAASLDVIDSHDIDNLITSKEVRTNPKYAYLEACLKENLRLHPIASEMGRRTGTSWVTLAGYSLPPHTVVSASYRDLMRNPQHWPDADAFIPERWLDEKERGDIAAPDMSAYYPFSAGRHSCIGINFAWAEMRLVAANILSRYDVIQAADLEIDFRQYITIQMRSGSWNMILKPRTPKAV